MKKIINILSLIVFASNFILAQDIRNSGFELADTSYNTNLSNWTNKTKEYSIKADSITVFNGKYSMKITGHNQRRYGFFEQKLPFNCVNARKYKFSGYIKSENVLDGYTGLTIKVLSGKKTIYADYAESIMVIGTNDWQLYSTEFIADESVTDIKVGGCLIGNGRVWFDEFKIETLNTTGEILPDTVANYLDEVFSILASNSIRKDSVDIEQIKTRCRTLALGTVDPSNCYPIIKYALKQLGDSHSLLRTPKQISEWKKGNSSDNSSIMTQMTTGKIIRNNYAYLNMPHFESGDPNTGRMFADSLQSLIKHLNQSSPAGWILDLRENSGGHMGSMLAGIGPLLGDGVAGYYVFEDKKTEWSYKDGVAYHGDNIMVKTSTEAYKLQPFIPTAVLIGPRTASSGEIIAISFIGRLNAKLFGEPTLGLTTCNEQFVLSDGSMIFLTTGVDADRNNKLYGKKIDPDVTVEFTNKAFEEDADPVIQSALKWLENKVDNKK